MSWNQLPDHEQHELRTRLTTRQLSCYMLWLAGCSYERTSRMLTISVRTVRTHIHAAKIIHQQIQDDESETAA